MFIENSGVSAVITQVQCRIILLEDIASVCCALTACKLLQAAAMIIIVALAGAAVSPLRTVLQHHMCIAFTVIGVHDALKIGICGIQAQCYCALVFADITDTDITVYLYITIGIGSNNLAILQLGVYRQQTAYNIGSTASAGFESTATDISGRYALSIAGIIAASDGNYIAAVTDIHINQTGNLQVGTAGVFPDINAIFYLKLAGMEFNCIIPTISIIDSKAGKALTIMVGTLLVGASKINTVNITGCQTRTSGRKLHALNIVNSQAGRSNMKSMRTDGTGIKNRPLCNRIHVHRYVKTMSLHINSYRIIACNIDTTKQRCPKVQILFRCFGLQCDILIEGVGVCFSIINACIFPIRAHRAAIVVAFRDSLVMHACSKCIVGT